MSEPELTDADWKAIADRAHDAASAEADSHGLSVFVAVFDEGVKRYESRGDAGPADLEVDSLKARIAELERFAAATVLDWWDREGQGPEFEDMPAAVAALVREHHGKPIGMCRQCGKRVPIVDEQPTAQDFDPPSGICAWGCDARQNESPD